MLDADGAINFATELADAVERFLEQYEQSRGPLQSDLERGLVIAYVLGVMHCDLEALWGAVTSDPTFGPVKPRALFDECASGNEPAARARETLVADELLRRGWLSQQSD